MKHILIVDDHLVLRTGLKVLLQDFFDNLKFFEATDSDGALGILRTNRIDVIVLDLQIPNTDTIRLIEIISIRFPRAHILVFSMLSEKIYAQRTLKAGAWGFLPKDAPVEEMKKAFETVMKNKRYVSASLSGQLADGAERSASFNPFAKLSFREFEILNLLLSGYNISRISQTLNIKPSTAGTYKSRVFEKVNVHSLLELKEMATLHGLFNPLS